MTGTKLRMIFTAPLRRLDHRLRATRPAGAALIICVALLVILAILGTAVVSRARIDRYDSRQHSANTQIDLLLDGIVDMTKAAVISDLFDSKGNYRPAPPVNAGAADTYDNWDCATV